ncbi:MAG: DUF1178 family protein [Bordetella sp.]|nr:MAG: DUF1178 family protein [Bordetella sp.]
MSIKVFNLQCENGHIFEGWFGSHEDYEHQRTDGLLSCPICESIIISKILSAPYLKVTNHSKDPKKINDSNSEKNPAVESSENKLVNLQAAMLRHMREFIKKTENVGLRFAEEARLIHQGESPERPIRGSITSEERKSLSEDGIEVLIIPNFLDDKSIH